MIGILKSVYAILNYLINLLLQFFNLHCKHVTSEMLRLLEKCTFTLEFKFLT